MTTRRVFLALALCLAPLAFAAAQPRPRLLFDRAHGENEPTPPMVAAAERAGLDLAMATTPITAAGLAGIRVLYLRAPSTAIAPDGERAAIVAFVRDGGSLLLVMDENRRQDIAVVGANDSIEPFGLRLTPDDGRYVHNCGAIAKAGRYLRRRLRSAVQRRTRRRGRHAVRVSAGQGWKPAQPFAAWKKVDGGGRIVVMGEGMASLLLGVPEGRRLTGPPRDAQNTVYWGKDSAVFMEEVLAWLARR